MTAKTKTYILIHIRVMSVVVSDCLEEGYWEAPLCILIYVNHGPWSYAEILIWTSSEIIWTPGFQSISAKLFLIFL